jgi:hypothetical protein
VLRKMQPDERNKILEQGENYLAQLENL